MRPSVEGYNVKLVVFGLTVSSSWGNGHATLWRGLQRALAQRGWRVVFFERDVPYYAQNRDLKALPGGELILYRDWADIETLARRHLGDADVAMVTSYCPDGIAAGALASEAPRSLSVFYDLDTPITLARLRQGEATPYVGPRGLRDYELVLSYTGGAALEQLRSLTGAGWIETLYGHVDPERHHPAAHAPQYRAHLSYIGTYAADRQERLQRLFIDPAVERPDLRFVLAGAQYPEEFPWTDNIFFVRHLPPDEHPAFYASSRSTLNVTRNDMASMGWCPSGRLFEAAACGAAIISDRWEGLDAFFEPDREILVADTCQDVVDALDLSDIELNRIGMAARARVLDEHTSAHRAARLETLFARAADPARQEI
jgi:spore maturation protein CgeB